MTAPTIPTGRDAASESTPATDSSPESSTATRGTPAGASSAGPAGSATAPAPPPGGGPVARRTAEFWRAHWSPTLFWASVVLVATWFFAGAWERRWIADDGLIVLRTVRNLLAGNGAVFNVGERVEANTSTLWTYLIYFTQRLVDASQLELVALWLALVCSLVAVVSAMWGARVMWAGTLAHPGRFRHLVTTQTLMLPLGVLVYVVLPPARDFATSGLETGLVIAWLGVVWLLLQRWACAPHTQHVAGLPTPGTALLAFTAGLGPLVRPEMALVAVAVLAVIFCAKSGWLHRGWLVVIAGTLPVVYQVWRMSYYGLPYPNTAVAKDAGGAKWAQGWRYLTDLASPYLLVIPAVLAVAAVVVAALWLQAGRAGRAASSSRGGDATDRDATGDPASDDDAAGAPATTDHEATDDPASESAATDRPAGVDDASGNATIARDVPLLRHVPGVRRLPQLRSTPVATALIVACGVVLALYSVRVGGDFMHGRVLLPPLFTLLLPLSVLPLPLVGPAGRSRRFRFVGPVVAVLWLGVAAWAITTSLVQNPFPAQSQRISPSGIVDERIFYLQRTGHRNPVLARDYLDFPRMQTLIDEVRRNQTGAVFLPVGGVQDKWDVVEQDHPLPGLRPFELPDRPDKRVVFLNLGMTSMNLPLDVKVYDTVGLATPLAAHTDRMPDGRIGHDKYLPLDWFVAEAGVVENPHHYPAWVDPDWVEQAKVALTCPATVELQRSYTEPLTRERRTINLMNAFSFAQYRINRIPAYEVQRCGLPMPEEVDLEAFPR